MSSNADLYVIPKFLKSLLKARKTPLPTDAKKTGTLTITAAPRKGHFVLDGTNIALLHGPARPELRYVLALAHYLRSDGYRVSCFFDANTPYLFSDARDEQRACFDRLTTEQPWKESFTVVPSGTQADQWILELAKRENADVISNDRFKDRAKAHRWIWKRRHGIRIIGNQLTLETLDASIELLAQPEDYLLTLQT